MSNKRESRDEYKKRKEIEEARKAGTLPPERDNEGNLINPHIPEYMSKAPWYLNQEEGAGLKHQRLKEKERLDAIEAGKKRRFVTHRAKKYRKGSCKNCGSMSHKTKDCIERPRKRGAYLTGKDIAADEVVKHVQASTWVGKRDRWAGYDAEKHQKKINAIYKLAEQKRQQVREEQKQKKVMEDTTRKKDGGDGEEEGEDSDSDSSTDDDDTDRDTDDEDRIRDEMDGQFQSKHATFLKSTVRNLRIREDLPKYLRNLDTNSAHYDPKTRSMRANPTPNVPLDQLTYAGDNFVRYTGDAKKLAATQVFAWEAYNEGMNVNMQADPTMAAVMQKKVKKRKEELKKRREEKVLSTYGEQSEYKVQDRSLLFGETETEVRYTRDGRIKGSSSDVTKDVIPLTKYEQNVVLRNGHKNVFGSWYVGVLCLLCLLERCFSLSPSLSSIHILSLTHTHTFYFFSCSYTHTHTGTTQRHIHGDMHVAIRHRD
jgi:pre-mRNA-processing factor SLU7